MPNGFSKRGILALSLVAFFLAPAAQSGAWQDKDRVSVSSDGSEGNGSSVYSSISADGRYVAFQSTASNLVSGDTNGKDDIFVHDRQTGATTRVSVSSGGLEGNSNSYSPSISSDGSYVAFDSNASNLVPGDTNENYDIFVHERQTGATSRVSVGSDGSEGNGRSSNPSISADGRYVAFNSDAGNLVPVDTNGDYDVFVHDRQTGATSRVSVSSDGSEGNSYSLFPVISADGRYVAFASNAGNLVPGDTNGIYDIFVHDRQTGATSRVSVSSDGSEGNDSSARPSISADGRYAVFSSVAGNLVSGDTNGFEDIFVHDRQTGATSRVSVSSDGSEGNGYSVFPVISADGRYVAFQSNAINLVSGDTNGFEDVFVAFTPDGSFYFIPGKTGGGAVVFF
jgi:Tol biopolymer transport system component